MLISIILTAIVVNKFAFTFAIEMASHVRRRKYYVFMSFCGEDKHSNNFTYSLFQALHGKGIFAFKDDTHLNMGDSIAPEMLQAIERSRLFIVVFSKNYASSTWCMRQLLHICHCIQTSQRSVLPIFYDVSPLEVLQQSGCYEKAFAEHQERFQHDKNMMKEVQIWRQALTQVANFSGWDIHKKFTPQYEVIEEIIEEVTTIIMDHKISTLQKETEGTSSKKDVDPYMKLSKLMRIKDFISILLTYPMKLEKEGIFKSWIVAFTEWKGQLLSADDDTLTNKPWRGITPKVLRYMEGYVPMDIISKIERGERSIFNHHDALPEVILDLTVDLAVNQLIQTLFSRDYSACCVRLLARNLVEKRALVNKIVAALEEKHTMFGFDKDFLRALWINASTYESDAEDRVQEEINTMMAGSSVTQNHDIEEKMGNNMHLVIVVDADGNKKLDIQKVRFTTGIVVFITTETLTQAEKDDEFRISCTMDLNIRTQDHLLSWEVFCSYVGSKLVRSSMAIQRIAEQIVKECQGHLLATVLVAKYLQNVEDIRQWEVALDKLSNLSPFYDYQYSDRIAISRVMVNAFLHIIWENMDDIQKLCLEIILFVHNIKIGVPESILVSECGTMMPEYRTPTGGMKYFVENTAKKRARSCIQKFVQRFVLLKDRGGEVNLPMETYDIVKSLRSSNPSFIRHGALGLTEAPYVGRWHALIRIELMDNNICELPESPYCPKLEVLLLQGNIDLMEIPQSFFNHMPVLQHLDLSYTSIRDLPPSIYKLIQLKKFDLRGCDLLMELPPEIGQLKNLQEFNLDGTLITHLPKEVGELNKLQSLTLCFDRCHQVLGHVNQIPNSYIIPPGVISNLTELNYLSIVVDPEDERWNENVYIVLVEISGLERLKTMSMYIPKADLLELITIKRSLNLRLIVGHDKRRFISRVTPEVEDKFKCFERSIKFVNGVNVPAGVKMIVGHLKALYLDRHMTIKNLSEFELKNLQWLEGCILVECNEMETIVDGNYLHVTHVLPGLECLNVFYMKNLRSVCQGSNPCFLYLKSIALHTCPMLTTVFTFDSLNKLVSLEEIIIEDCPKVTTLISLDSPQQTPDFLFLFPKLRRMSLLYLPELVNIFNGQNVENDLEALVIYYCPKLQSLSKGELSSKSLKMIKGESMWWQSLKWNAADWGDFGPPSFLETIFSPIIEAELTQLTRLPVPSNKHQAAREDEFLVFHEMTDVMTELSAFQEKASVDQSKIQQVPVKIGNESDTFGKLKLPVGILKSLREGKGSKPSGSRRANARKYGNTMMD